MAASPKVGKIEVIRKRLATLEAKLAAEKERVEKAKRRDAARLASIIGGAFLADLQHHQETAEVIQTVLTRARGIKPRDADFLISNKWLYPTWTPPDQDH